MNIVGVHQIGERKPPPGIMLIIRKMIEPQKVDIDLINNGKEMGAAIIQPIRVRIVKVLVHTEQSGIGKIQIDIELVLGDVAEGLLNGFALVDAPPRNEPESFGGLFFSEAQEYLVSAVSDNQVHRHQRRVFYDGLVLFF